MQFSTSFVDEPCKRRFSRHIFLFDQGNSWIQNSLSVIGSRLPIVFIVDAEEAPFSPLIYLHLLVSQLELLAAKNLIGANLNGTSDPYAIITCGEQKKFR